MFHYALRSLLIVSVILIGMGIIPVNAQTSVYYSIPNEYDQMGYIYPSFFTPIQGEDWDVETSLGLAFRDSNSGVTMALYFENNQTVASNGYVETAWTEISEWSNDIWILSRNVPGEIIQTDNGYVLIEIPEVSYNNTVFFPSHRTNLGMQQEVFLYVPELNNESSYTFSIGDDSTFEGYNTIPTFNSYFLMDEIYQGDLENFVGVPVYIQMYDSTGNIVKREFTRTTDLVIDFDITNLLINADVPTLSFFWMLNDCEITFDAGMTSADQNYVYNRDGEMVTFGSEPAPLSLSFYDNGYRFQFVQFGEVYNYIVSEFALNVYDPRSLLASYMSSQGCE